MWALCVFLKKTTIHSVLTADGMAAAWQKEEKKKKERESWCGCMQATTIQLLLRTACMAPGKSQCFWLKATLFSYTTNQASKQPANQPLFFIVTFTKVSTLVSLWKDYIDRPFFPFALGFVYLTVCLCLSLVTTSYRDPVRFTKPVVTFYKGSC